MHASFARLLQFLGFEAVDRVASNRIAHRLGLSQQCVANWQKRGVSKEGAIAMERAFGVAAQWILHGTGAMRLESSEPESISCRADGRYGSGLSDAESSTALSERMRMALSASGLTQAELARRVGVRQPSVNDWLSGKTKILKAATALKVATALRVDPAWLLWGDGQGPVSGEYSSGHPPLPSLEAALKTMLDAIHSCPARHKEEVRQLLLLLLDHDAPAYRQRLLEMLKS